MSYSLHSVGIPLTIHSVADPEVDLFAGMKKKKKKQVAADVDDAPSASTTSAFVEPTSAPVAEVAPVAQAAPVVEAAAGSGAAPPVDGDKVAEDGADLFGDMKKKKKKKKEMPLDLVSLYLDINSFSHHWMCGTNIDGCRLGH